MAQGPAKAMLFVVRGEKKWKLSWRDGGKWSPMSEKSQEYEGLGKVGMCGHCHHMLGSLVNTFLVVN